MQVWRDCRFVFGDMHFDFDQCKKNFKHQFILKITQVHGSDGFFVKKDFDLKNYIPIASDFVITNQKGLLLHVLTADCLPIFLYDPVLKVVGVVHAGWKGSVAGILDNAILLMKKEFKTKVKDVHLFFGPCAKTCCYQIKSDCIDTMKQFDSTNVLDSALITRDILTYFDLCMYNIMRAYNLGILTSNIFTHFSVCTMCTNNFFSYRKQGEKTARNINGIILL